MAEMEVKVPLAHPAEISNTNAKVNNGTMNGHAISAEDVMEKYRREREKRMRSDGMDQYVDPQLDEKFKQFQADPWVTVDTPNPGLDSAKSGDRHKVLIIGAGFGGMLVAARLLEAGIDDFVMVDIAGGFGGTWYWNRYPGLMCDVESYVYLPLLEETGYIPKQKYSTGYEIRQYAELIADKYKLLSKALFRTKVRSMSWSDEQRQWDVSLGRVGSEDTSELLIKAEVVIPVTGILNLPKMVNLPGILDFKGESFHTSRWDYAVTGGDQASPDMVNLKDKRVGILGTGLTAVQAIPHLAQWSKELYVFQRTPSAVDVRANKATDVSWFKKEVSGSGKGWHRRRAENFNAHISDAPTGNDMVRDEWTRMRTFSVLVGKPGKISDIGAYVANAQSIDLPRQERIRQRVDQVVKDKETAQKLKPWYAGWCKRPAFHDGYLETFNRPNVTLVDTQGKGVERATADGLVVAGKEYPVDVLVLSTGFYTPASDSPATRAHSKIFGRNGVSLDDTWSQGISTLHGVITPGFPNLLFPGPHQSGASANAVYMLDVLSEHIVWLLVEAQKRGKDGRIYVEAESEASETWAQQVASRALVYAPIAGCTPGYLNGEGAADQPKSQEQMAKAARGALWGEGIADYLEQVNAWKASPDLNGVVFQVPAEAIH